MVRDDHARREPRSLAARGQGSRCGRRGPRPRHLGQPFLDPVPGRLPRHNLRSPRTGGDSRRGLAAGGLRQDRAATRRGDHQGAWSVLRRECRQRGDRHGPPDRAADQRAVLSRGTGPPAWRLRHTGWTGLRLSAARVRPRPGRDRAGHRARAVGTGQDRPDTRRAPRGTRGCEGPDPMSERSVLHGDADLDRQASGDGRGSSNGQSATLSYDGRTTELPVIRGSEGEPAIDIGRLRAETGLITMDRGYMNTGSCLSAITFLDGERGVLRYRGYPIEQLAEKSSFLEVAYLLTYGELPTRAQLEAWTSDVTHHTLIHEEMRRFFDSFPYDAHPMAVLASATVGLSTFYQDSHDPFDPAAVELTIQRLIAKLPTLAAWSFKKAIGQPYVYPRNDLDYAANLLHMMFAVPAEPYEVHPDVAKALDLLLILHADHEQNCSTSTVRLVGSSQVNLYASISAAISALWGPLHGGANEAVIRTLERIAADGGDVQKYIDKAKDPNHEFKLPGFGHRVYKNFDPRARIIKAAADRVLAATGADDRLYEIARQLEEVALHDEYFVKRKLYPNVDFYSGLIYRAIGFPKNMFTNCFAIGRLPGWIAQWKEMIGSADTKIGRPRQIYTGATARDYVPLEAR